MDKRPIGYIPGKGNPLDKKVKKSKKYDYVKATLQTGPTIRDIEVVSKNLKRTIIFRQLLNFQKEIRNIQKNQNLHIIEIIICNLNQSLFTSLTIFKRAFMIQNKISSSYQPNNSMITRVYLVQQANRVKQANFQQLHMLLNKLEQLFHLINSIFQDQTTFLLLDLREKEDFEMFHIKESINYPAPFIKQDKLIPQIMRYKNQEGKLIIITHLDEKHGIPSATIFGEKGFENVYLLSGGVEAFLQKYPDLIEGKKVPVLPKVQGLYKKTKSKILKRSDYMESKEPSQIGFVRNPETNSQVSEVRSQFSKQSKVSRTKSQNK